MPLFPELFYHVLFGPVLPSQHSLLYFIVTVLCEQLDGGNFAPPRAPGTGAFSLFAWESVCGLNEQAMAGQERTSERLAR